MLSDVDRAQLNRDFFDHVLGVAGKAIGPEHCVVVSASTEVRERAGSSGACTIADPADDDLNAALAAGATFAADRGAGSVLSLSCDLPLLRPDDLGALIAASRDDTVAIASDARGRGTNAMIIAPGAIPYRYGADSLRAHRELAKAAGLRCVIVRSPGFARDIDTPADLAAWRGQAAPR